MESEKPYQLTVENRPGYLYILVKAGEQVLEDVKQQVREIAEALKRSGQSKGLIDMDIKEPLSMSDNFWLISEFHESELHLFDIAVVDGKPEHQKVFQFAEAAASNRGMNIKSFTSVEEAERWLAEY